MFSPRTLQFLRDFYASPNLLTWDRIEAGSLTKFKPYLSRLERKTPSSTVLPYMERDKSFTWFAVAFDETSFIRLRELLRSFIGPTFSDMDPFRSNRTPHIQDLNVQAYTNGYYLKFRGDDTVIGEKVQLLFKLLKERPDQRAQTPHDPQPLLRNFELALQACEEETAAAQIDILERYLLIDPRNALFMRIEMLARLEQWQRMLDHPQMEDLLKASRPARITEGIIRAVYAVYLEPLQSDPLALMAVFEEAIWPQYQSLYRIRGSLSHPHTLVSFMLRAIVPDHSVPQLRDELLVVGAGTPIESLLQALASKQSGTATVTPLEVTVANTKLLIDQGQFEQAFEMAIQLSDCRERSQFILICAYEIQSLAVDRTAIDAVLHVQESEWRTLLTTRHLSACYDYLLQHQKGQTDKQQPVVLPSNWNKWFANLEQLDPNTLTDIAKRGANEWSREGFLDQRAEMDQLVHHIQAYADTDRELIHFSRIYLLQYFVDDPLWPRTELKNVYGELHRFFLQGMRGTRIELKIAMDWSNSMVRIGLTPSENRQLFEGLTRVWRKFASVEFLQLLLPFLQNATKEPNLDRLSCLRLIHQIREHLSGKSIISEQNWLEIEQSFIPYDWQSWFSILYEAEDDYSFLSDWIGNIGDQYEHWTPNSIRRCNDWLTQWIIEEQPPSKKTLLGRAISPFAFYVLRDPNFPSSEETEFYENLADAIRMYAVKNEQTLQHMSLLLEGLFFRKPESVTLQWWDTRKWLAFHPIVNLLSVVFDVMELFNDYGIPSMEIKSLWDDWVGVLYNKLDENTEGLRPYLIALGEGVAGNYHLLEQLRISEEEADQANGDPLAQLKDMKITIFSCREKAANRAAEQIMHRNSRIKVRVCTNDRASDQTTAYARQSDLSIVVTSCISHALTYGIRDELANEPVYPRSSGEAGIVSRLEEYAIKGK